jgi:hypothetical protein
MNILFTVFLQVLLWAGYSTVLYLSHHDHSFFELILLIMFAYFNYLVSLSLIQDRHLSLVLTVAFTLIYVLARWLFIYTMT